MARHTHGRKDLFSRRQGAYVGPDRTTRRLGLFSGFVDRSPIHLRRDDATCELSLPPHPAIDVSAFCALSGVKVVSSGINRSLYPMSLSAPRTSQGPRCSPVRFHPYRSGALWIQRGC